MAPAREPRHPASRWRGWSRAGWWRADGGYVTAFVVVLMTGILALAGVALDGGLALAAKVRAIGQAEAAARAGAQQIDLDTYRSTGQIVLAPDAAIAAAHAHLQTAAADGAVTVENDVIVVRVTATQPTQLLGLVGVNTLTVQGEARSIPVSGSTTAQP
jgi:hypothetical protein